jgi:hypothetical protein
MKNELTAPAVETTDMAPFDALSAEVTLMVAPIKAIVVTDEATKKQALDAGAQLKALSKKVEARREEIAQPLHRRWKAVLERVKTVVNPLDAAETHLREQLGKYDRQVREKAEAEARLLRERQEAERRAAEERERAARAEADKKAKAERDALEAKQRQEREARERADRERSEAASLFKKKQDDQAEIERREAARIADERAAADRKALEEQQARDRLANEARAQREREERAAADAARLKDVENQKVENSRRTVVIEVLNWDLVPGELLRRELKVKEIEARFKGGETTIAGLKLSWGSSVSLKAAPTEQRALA